MPSEHKKLSELRTLGCPLPKQRQEINLQIPRYLMMKNPLAIVEIKKKDGSRQSKT